MTDACVRTLASISGGQALTNGGLFYISMAFMGGWEATLIQEGICKKGWECQISASEIMTIMILFHQ